MEELQRLTVQECIAWAERHHYPQLVLGEHDVLLPGITSWYSLLLSEQRWQRAAERIAAWQKRCAAERSA